MITDFGDYKRWYYVVTGLPYQHYNRNHNKMGDLPYAGWGGGSQNPSGGSPGAYYGEKTFFYQWLILGYVFLFIVGTGHNPNEGSAQLSVNDPNFGVHVVDYNHQKPSLNPQQQYQQYSLYNNYNAGQRPNIRPYHFRPYIRHPNSNQGYYTGGGSFWYNKGQSQKPHVSLFAISMVIWLICI